MRPHTATDTAFTSLRGPIRICGVYACEIAMVGLLLRPDFNYTLSFVSHVVTHFFLPGLTILAIFFAIYPGQRIQPPFLPLWGTIVDLTLLLTCWRFDIMTLYLWYPLLCAVLILGLTWITPLRWTSLGTIPRVPSCWIAFIVLVSVMSLYLFASTPEDPHIVDQIVGLHSVARGWPPQNLFVADLPYSNNYLVHAMMYGVLLNTGIGPYFLVTKFFPIYLTWLFARSLRHFCTYQLRLRPPLLLVTESCIFLTGGFSIVVGHIFVTPTITAALAVQSTLLSYTIMLLCLGRQAQCPESRGGRAFALLLVALIVFLATGARAQLAPVLISAQLLLLAHSLVFRDRAAAIWHACVLACMVLAAFSGLLVFLSAGSGFSGASFLSIQMDPSRFIVDNLSFFYLPHWLSTLGLPVGIAALIGYFVLVVLQPSFLLPGLCVFLVALWHRKLAAYRSIEVLLVGVVIAGVTATSLTEAPGGSHYVFLHYSKIAAVVLGAAGLQFILRRRRRQRKVADAVLAASLVLGIVHFSDMVWEYHQAGRKAIDLAMTFEPPAALASLSKITNDLPDGDRSVFIYLDGVGRSIETMPARLGFQVLASRTHLEEYVRWKSPIRGALERRLCFLEILHDEIGRGVVRDAAVNGLGTTLVGRYSAIYLIIPTTTGVKGFDDHVVIRTPEFHVFRLARDISDEMTTLPENGLCNGN